MRRVSDTSRAISARIELRSLALITVCLTAIAATPTYSSNRSFDQRYYIEYFTYRADEPGKSLQDIYMLIPTRNFVAIKSEHGFQIRFQASVNFRKTTGGPTQTLAITDSIEVSSAAELSRPRSHYLQFSFIVPPGEYESEFEISDLNARQKITFVEFVNVADFSADDFEMSQLKVGRTSNRSRAESISYLEAWNLTPNILHQFTNMNQNIQVFAEIYGLSFRPTLDNSSVLASFVIQDSDGKPVCQTERSIPKHGDANFIYAEIPTKELSPGAYRLLVRVQDLESGKTAEREYAFSIVSPVLM